MSSYIDETGFHIERFPEILANLETEYKEKFGDELDWSDENPVYQVASIDAKHEADINELAQATYNSFDPDTATGIALDFVCGFTGIERLKALPTIVNAMLYGEEGKSVPTGKVAAKNSGAYLFNLKNEVNFDSLACSEILLGVTSVENSTLYRIVITKGITSVTYSYTSAASATLSGILVGMAAIINGDTTLAISAVPFGNYLRIYVDNYIDTDMAISITTSTLLEIFEVGCFGSFECQQTGPVVINSGELSVISTPVQGWSSVTNYLTGITGRDRESDDILRARRAADQQNNECSTDLGIQKAVLQGVSGVTYAVCISNRTNATVDTIPPKAFRVVVEGGDDTEIAEAIFAAQPAGILSDGTTSVTITDSEGYPQIVKFSRPESVYIWINLTWSGDGTQSADADTLIKQNIVDQAASLFSKGSPVIRQKLFQPVYDVTGIDDIPLFEMAATLNLTPPDPGDYSESNIDITRFQASAFAINRITTAEV